MCRVSLVVKYSLNPPVISILTVPRQCNFCEFFCVICVCLCHSVMSAICSLVFTCCERADLLAHLCVMFLCVLSVSHTGLVHVSIPDLCLFL